MLTLCGQPAWPLLIRSAHRLWRRTSSSPSSPSWTWSSSPWSPDRNKQTWQWLNVMLILNCSAPIVYLIVYVGSPSPGSVVLVQYSGYRKHEGGPMFRLMYAYFFLILSYIFILSQVGKINPNINIIDSNVILGIRAAFISKQYRHWRYWPCIFLGLDQYHFLQYCTPLILSYKINYSLWLYKNTK